MVRTRASSNIDGKQTHNQRTTRVELWKLSNGKIKQTKKHKLLADPPSDALCSRNTFLSSLRTKWKNKTWSQLIVMMQGIHATLLLQLPTENQNCSGKTFFVDWSGQWNKQAPGAKVKQVNTVRITRTCKTKLTKQSIWCVGANRAPNSHEPQKQISKTKRWNFKENWKHRRNRCRKFATGENTREEKRLLAMPPGDVFFLQIHTWKLENKSWNLDREMIFYGALSSLNNYHYPNNLIAVQNTLHAKPRNEKRTANNTGRQPAELLLWNLKTLKYRAKKRNNSMMLKLETPENKRLWNSKLTRDNLPKQKTMKFRLQIEFRVC